MRHERGVHTLIYPLERETLTIFESTEQHRTCAACGAGYPTEPFETDSSITIAFSCPEHGAHTVVDQFEGSR